MPHRPRLAINATTHHHPTTTKSPPPKCTDYSRQTVADSITPGGSFVFSVEHPIYSAPTTQAFETSAAGHQVWPLDHYLTEGERVRDWFVDGVVKQHRTVAAYVNTVIGSGLVVKRLVEWGPTAEAVADRPELAKDLHRPWFLLIEATKPAK